MKKSIKLILIVLLIIIGDRFLFMSNRLNNVWEFETGNYIGDPISKKQNILVKNNFEIKIYKNNKSAFYYLLGCYYGELFLLEKGTLKYTRYTSH